MENQEKTMLVQKMYMNNVNVLSCRLVRFTMSVIAFTTAFLLCTSQHIRSDTGIRTTDSLDASDHRPVVVDIQFGSSFSVGNFE